MQKPTDILGLIGNTPIVELKQLDTGLCRLFVKLENQNPGGSIKDRIALSMINYAQKSGRLKPGSTVIEATAGNTGLGLALVCGQRQLRLLLVIPDKMSREKIANLKALGAEVVITRSDVIKGHPDYYHDLAARLAADYPNSHYIDQFNNPANPLAHQTTTGPEIWSQLNSDVDAIVCGVGTGGTIGGLTKFFSVVKPDLEFVIADPVGSIVTHYVETGIQLTESGSWLVEGIGEDFIPPLADLSMVRRAFSIPDRESLHTARGLLEKEGILAGSSTGTLLAAALRYCREQKVPKKVLTFVCDSGNKYLSKMFDNDWMRDQGFIHEGLQGDLRDLISRRYDNGITSMVESKDTLLTAFSRMRVQGLSHLPVLEGDRILGIVDEFDILSSAHSNPTSFNRPVSDLMTTELVTLLPTASVEALFPIFERGLVAIIEDGGKYLGIITRRDYLNYLRRKFS